MRFDLIIQAHNAVANANWEHVCAAVCIMPRGPMHSHMAQSTPKTRFTVDNSGGTSRNGGGRGCANAPHTAPKRNAGGKCAAAATGWSRRPFDGGTGGTETLFPDSGLTSTGGAACGRCGADAARHALIGVNSAPNLFQGLIPPQFVSGARLSVSGEFANE